FGTGTFVALSNTGGVGGNAVFSYTPTASGDYAVIIADSSNGIGQFGVDVSGIAATNHLLTTGDDGYTGVANERILGGTGNDTIDVGAGLDALGEQGNDNITGNSA